VRARSLLPVLALLVLAVSADAAVRLFLLSGQSNMKGLDPAVSFTPAIEAAYPDDECIVVHHARSGQQIRRWIED